MHYSFYGINKGLYCVTIYIMYILQTRLLYYILIEQSLKERLGKAPIFARPVDLGAKTAAKVEHFFQIRKFLSKKGIFFMFFGIFLQLIYSKQGANYAKAFHPCAVSGIGLPLRGIRRRLTGCSDLPGSYSAAVTWPMI